jgi:hypothetical protein
MKNLRKYKLLIGVVLVLTAVLSRLVPHEYNMTSITAVALFSAVYFEDKRFVFGLPLGALILSDLILYFYYSVPMGPIQLVVYLCFVLIVLIGFLLKKYNSVPALFGAAASGSISFFLITNFAVWLFWEMYPKTVQGLIACFAAGLPFFRNMFFGDIIFTSILFGLYHVAVNMGERFIISGNKSLV